MVARESEESPLNIVLRLEQPEDYRAVENLTREAFRREISNYNLLTSLGVPVLPMLKYTGAALLLPDVESDARFRLGCERVTPLPTSAM